MCPLRKAIFLLLLLMLTLGLACAAADTEYSLSPCPGTITIPEKSYIVLTKDNLGEHPELLSRIGMTQDEVLADWEDRGVVLQAWFRNEGTRLDSCMEIVVRQDDDSAMYYDLVNHSADAGWKTFLSSHKSSSKYADQGYSILEAEKKQQANRNYMLRLKYKRTTDDVNCKGYAVTSAEKPSNVVYWGHAYKTVARGYTVFVDYQVYNRGLRSGDETALRKMVNTMIFTDAPAADGSSVSSSGAYLQITSEPPQETNSDTFTVEGITTPGAHLIGVLMNINSSVPARFYTDANNRGAFKMKITIPKEDIWLLTLNVEVNDEIVAEKAFSVITYSKTLLPLTLESTVPERLTSDVTVISGYTDKGVDIQCIASTSGKNIFNKQYRTYGNGKFTFKIPTADEAEYNFTLVFTKKGYTTKRYTYTAVRSLSEEDRRAATISSAVRPGYSTLVRNLDKYVDKVTGYTVYIVSIEQSGDEYVIRAAMNKNKAGYKNFLVYMTYEEPVFEPDSQQLLYGKCIGFYEEQSEEGSENYPAFDLLFAN